jgi:creatinine amidohydrolase
MTQTERRYEYLYGDELFDLIQECPLAWLPLGILEKHGGHLPWGLDGLKAHAVCLRLAKRLGGVVLPATHLAGIHGDCREADESTFRSRHATIGDFLYREETFRTFLTETFDSLANIGFRVIVAYTGHYPDIQTRILKEAAETFTATSPLPPFEGGIEGGCRVVVIPFWEPLACGEGDHAGKWETSLYLALAPDAVRLDAIADERTGQAGYYRGQDVRTHTSKAFGERALAQVEAYLTEAVERALDTIFSFKCDDLPESNRGHGSMGVLGEREC